MSSLDTFRGKRVLVTGHTGFKGSWLTTWLVQLGAEVTGYALPPEREQDHFVLLNLTNKIIHHEANIRHAERLLAVMREARPEFVFHLAAQSLVRRSYREPVLTFETNLLGSVNVLEAVRAVDSVKVLIYVTTDKCYKNKNWTWGYRENDELGGSDPYSASKACAELAFSGYQMSYFQQRPGFAATSVRSGNVIGGGDWAEDRIVPDCIQALQQRTPIRVRNPEATRPWQHVLEPLGGYLLLASRLWGDHGKEYAGPWNFGPDIHDNRSVSMLVEAVIDAWGSGTMEITMPTGDEPHEASLLHLNSDKAAAGLGWRPVWGFRESVWETVQWYRRQLEGTSAWDLTSEQIQRYMELFAKG